MYDAVIIGAGMSGLTAGIRLAMFGKKVCIIESHYLWGGLNSFYKKDGRPFDVGLHAMTNFAPKGDRKSPLSTVARQLRLSLDAFELLEQKESLIAFPDVRLRFSNDLELLTQEIHEKFPQHIDEFRNLCKKVRAHDEGNLKQVWISARQTLRQLFSSPVLADMILCPLLFYGSAVEDDMEWNQFVIMFKAIYFQGFARPHGGVRVILKRLRDAYRDHGGELRTKSRVTRIMPRKNEGTEVQLANGDTLTAKKVISSAGYVETMNLLGKSLPASEAGQMSFVETIFCLDRPPQDLNLLHSIVFFNRRSEGFSYRKPTSAVDFTSGIVCCPNNFRDDQPLDGMIRVTHIANHERWKALHLLSDGSYQAAKEELVQTQLEMLAEVVPPFRNHITYTDSFTPVTIERFTSHCNGAVYGTPRKRLSGTIGEDSVFLCGTDQGYLGIVGAMLSGILVANRHVLHEELNAA